MQTFSKRNTRAIFPLKLFKSKSSTSTATVIFNSAHLNSRSGLGNLRRRGLRGVVRQQRRQSLRCCLSSQRFPCCCTTVRLWFWLERHLVFCRDQLQSTPEFPLLLVKARPMPHGSGSQTCSSCYPNQGSDYVLITLSISQWSLII